jgi:hypothetical protein
MVLIALKNKKGPKFEQNFEPYFDHRDLDAYSTVTDFARFLG